MNRKLIAVCNRDAIQNVMPPMPYAVISIIDPPFDSHASRPIILRSDPDRIAWLTLSFADFHEKHFKFKHDGRSLREWAMTEQHARQVKEFLDETWERLGMLLIHCEAGVSRSPSMALAIAEHYGVSRSSLEPVGRSWDFQPLNPYVYRLMKEALR